MLYAGFCLAWIIFPPSKVEIRTLFELVDKVKAVSGNVWVWGWLKSAKDLERVRDIAFHALAGMLL